MPDVNIEYGKLTSVQEASLMSTADIALQGTDGDADSVPGEGNSLWLYQTQGRIYGIPVEDSARSLKIDSDEMLDTVFQLDRRPKSLLLALAPGEQSALDEYDRLLDKVYNGTASILSEDRQFDQVNGRFIVWVRYEELKYVLHPRFSYLREE